MRCPLWRRDTLFGVETHSRRQKPLVSETHALLYDREACLCDLLRQIRHYLCQRHILCVIGILCSFRTSFPVRIFLSYVKTPLFRQRCPIFRQRSLFVLRDKRRTQEAFVLRCKEAHPSTLGALSQRRSSSNQIGMTSARDDAVDDDHQCDSDEGTTNVRLTSQSQANIRNLCIIQRVPIFSTPSTLVVTATAATTIKTEYLSTPT